MVGVSETAICYNYGDPEGGRGFLIELGGDVILSEFLTPLPTTPPQASLYLHA